MVSRKIIKKFAQFTVILLLVVAALPVTAYLLLQSDRIQSNLANRIMLMVSDKLGTKFSIGNIDMAFFYRIRLNDVYLQDLSGDTLIYASSITTGIRSLNPLNRTISIGSINLDKAFIALAIDSASELNLNYFLNKLKGDGNKQGGWKVDFNNFKLQNSRFSLKNFDYQPKEYGMNFSDIRAYNINADIKYFKPSKDSLSFYVKSLSLKEQSGLILEKMVTHFSQSKTFLSFRDVEIRTPDSEIRGDEISLRFAGFSKFKSDSFVNSVRLRLNLSQASFNLHDIGYFAAVFRDIHQQIALSGLFTGPLNNLRGRDLTIGFGNSSKLVGDLQFEGLPEIRQTFILADIKEFTTSALDIGSMQFLRQSHIRIPETLNKLGQVTYKGNFTGFINDFVAYGRFNTALGIIRTDLLFRPDTANFLTFQGKLNAQDFNIGSFLNASEKVGNISLSATIDGATLQGKSFNASLNGVIERFEVMKYEYTNISMSGDLDHKTFNGSVNVHDPNIDLEFLGKVNFSDSVPAFDFTANVTDANPYALNLSRRDPEFRASCYIIAKAKGNSINSMNGEIKLLNSLFIKKDKQLQIYDLSISSETSEGNNRLQLRSDFMDADLSGNFELTKSGETFRQFVYMYLPSILDSATFITEPIRNRITFISNIKNIKPILDFFSPDYSLADNSLLNLTYKPDNQQMELHFESSLIRAKSLVWNNMNVNITSNSEVMQFDAGSELMKIGKGIWLENFTATANSSSDTAGIRMRWNNWRDLQYKGFISALASISREPDCRHPHIEISMRQSEFVTKDTVWTIQPGTINIDSTAIRFNNMAINHKNEYFRIDGAITENPSDLVNVVFNRFNLANFNGISATSGYNFGGTLNGSAKLSGIYSNPLFTSILKIDSLMINNEILGTTEMNSSWDDNRKAILLDAFALRDNLKTINLKGEYLPAGEGKLAFELQLEKLRLHLFNPYVKSIFTDLRGIASGKASLTGSLSRPILNGELNLQKTSFTVNYLQTRYNFSEKIQIENNNIYFDDIRIYDPKGNSAWLNGAIRNRYLKEFVLDLNIRSENFMSLNTTLADNKQFYGTAYATGVIKIQGPLRNIFMDITATTDKNTTVNIPLSNSAELNEYPYIEVNDLYGQDDLETEESEYQADLSGLQIRFRLIVTPDAEVQIIIDPKLGEIIKGRGNGNLDMRINTSGDFLMTGDYVIEKGDYLFTLQKVINKKLTIEPGGSIHWDGDPLDATVDIVANYRTRASVRDLLGDKYGKEDDQKVVVDDRVTLSGKLMSPDIKYDIYLPDADEATRLMVNGAVTTSEEKSKQFISLLMTNRFSLSSSGGSNASPYTGAAGVNFSEMLSNQLSNWLSQIVNDLDVDVNYRSNRDMNSDEVQLALSYQFFNDKLTVSGSLDMATNATTNATKEASDEIVGEFDIDYKLTPNGKFRLKTYNHANNELLYKDNSSYTQGLGFTYKEEFNTFGEFLRRLFGKKEEVTGPVDQNDDTPPVVNNYP